VSPTSLADATLRALLAPLDQEDAAFHGRFPGEPSGRQPVHVVYGGAHLFAHDTVRKVGSLALAALEAHAPDFCALARVLDLPGAAALPTSPEGAAALAAQLSADPRAARAGARQAWLAHAVHGRVVAKLRAEPVEDYRLDFEDGYGVRPDAEEDQDALKAAAELAKGLAAGTLPPFVGVRIKSLSREHRARAVRTLDLVLTALVKATGGRLPPGFVVTLPKVENAAQVSAAAGLLEALESALGLPPRALPLEVMVELTQSLVTPQGTFALPGILDAARGRLRGAHFGTYDYTASCNITSSDQRMTHPSADFARHLMQVSLARTGVFLSDGATNVMPIGPNRAGPGQTLSEAQRTENRAAVHHAWRLHHLNITDSLQRGFFQGWDLHPAQVPVRYASTYAYFLEAMDASAARLKRFVERAAQATLVGSVFDDAATGQGLLNFFTRALGCGALGEAEVVALTGLPADRLATRSFSTLVEGAARQGGAA
jgi:citrate lyase beta subunit